VGTPAALIDELVAALTAAIEELTRPIDAIKHQAKTVTVGISRSDEEVLVARGRRDGRIVIFVPEVKSGTCVGITLLHVLLHERLEAGVMRSVLQGYDNRYDRLVDWVHETEGEFDESKLAELPVEDLLIDPISDAADLWRGQ